MPKWNELIENNWGICVKCIAKKRCPKPLARRFSDAFSHTNCPFQGNNPINRAAQKYLALHY